MHSGETIRIGESILIKSMTEGRVSLAVDAPKSLKIDRIDAESNKTGERRPAK